MKILICYATNSGSTQAATDIIAHVFTEKNHTVDIRYVSDVKPEDLAQFDGVIFGSPSWDYEGNEGQPHEDMTNFMRQLTTAHLQEKKVALFAMGDTSYTYFGGAVDVMNTYMKKLNIPVVGTLLRVDKFFSNSEAQQSITAWANEIESQFSK